MSKHRIMPGYVSRAAAARALEPLVLAAGGPGLLAQECHTAAPDVPLDTFARMIYRIRVGKARNRKGKAYIQSQVSYDTVDRILVALDRTDLWHSEELRRWGEARPGRKVQPRRYKLRADTKMTLDDVKAAHREHMDGKSIRQLGRDLWERYGYANARSCANTLSERFLMEGLPTRSREDATRLASTKHGLAPRGPKSSNLAFKMHRRRLRVARGEQQGRRCGATVKPNVTSLERPCRRWALWGSEFCFQHDPANRELVLASVAAARSLRAA
jgi:hypothetical protein